MSVQETKKKATRAFFQSLRDNDGLTPLEADDRLNDAQRDLIDAMVEANGVAYLGDCDPPKNEPVKFSEYTGEGIVYNFGASFVVPVDDQQLKELLHERVNTPYTGTKQDYKFVEAIHDRIREIGGYVLTWS